MDALKKAGRSKQFDEKAKGRTSIEAKLNAAEAVLKDAGILRESSTKTDRMTEVMQQLSNEQHRVFSEQRKKNANMGYEEQLKLAEAILSGEFKPPTKKNNGGSDNFNESNPWNGDRTNNFSPGYITETTNPCEKGDKIMIDWLLNNGKITEAQHRKLTGQKPEGYEQLSEQQRKEFDFARLIGISESDAFKVARITGSDLREVSRR
jgi:hypothetical protein